MKKHLFIATTWIFISMSSANLQAQEEATNPQPVKLMAIQPAGEVELHLGCSKMTGYLSENSWVSTTELGYNIYTTRDSYFSLSFGKTTLTHQGSSFPFANNDKISISSFSMGPHLYFYDKNDLRLGVGVGLTQLMVSDSGYNNMQSYGTFYWALQAKYDLTKQWNLGYATRWQMVPGRSNNVSYFFEQWSHFLTLGYSFSFAKY